MSTFADKFIKLKTDEFSPPKNDLDVIEKLANGRCLDLGTGAGASLGAMLRSKNVTSVYSLESDLNWFIKPYEDERVTYALHYSDKILVPGLFDFVFIDHFPLRDRIYCADFFKQDGVETLIHDARLTRYIPVGFHEHYFSEEGFLHYTPKRCEIC